MAYWAINLGSWSLSIIKLSLNRCWRHQYVANPVAYTVGASVFAALPTSPSSCNYDLIRAEENIQVYFRDISMQCIEISPKWDTAVLRY